MVSEQVKRARLTAVIFGVLMSLALISFVYAFVTQAEATKQVHAADEKLKLYEADIEDKEKQVKSLQVKIDSLQRIINSEKERIKYR
jgi:peptidoglycan hydrolase CwlO-like protein